MTRLRALAVLPAVLAAAGCDLPAAPAQPRLWTLFDLQRLASGPTRDLGLAPAGGVPGGIPASHFISDDGGGTPSLALGDTWSDGLRAAYVATELWSGFARVWVQPVYLAETGFTAAGLPMVPADARPIFSVGPQSSFYSPYWQQVFFDLPDGRAAGDFTSSRQIIESGATLHLAASALRVLAPPSIGQPVDTGPGAGSRQIGVIPTGQGWLDGQEVHFLDFGTGTFKWDAARVVEELPLFVFTRRDDQGDLRGIDGVPTVAGSGPIGSGAPPDVSALGGQPRFGALWRLYTVTLPKGAGVFAPPQFGSRFDPANSGATVVTDVSAEIAGAPAEDVQLWVGRVALNPGCFQGTLAGLDPSNGPGGCVWLDSQGAIEREIDGEWIRRTDLLVTCPFVSYADAAVPP